MGERCPQTRFSWNHNVFSDMCSLCDFGQFSHSLLGIIWISNPLFFLGDFSFKFHWDWEESGENSAVFHYTCICEEPNCSTTGLPPQLLWAQLCHRYLLTWPQEASQQKWGWKGQKGTAARKSSRSILSWDTLPGSNAGICWKVVKAIQCQNKAMPVCLQTFLYVHVQ